MSTLLRKAKHASGSWIAGNQEDLPMYKDKPYGVGFTSKAKQRRRKIVLWGLSVVCVLFFIFNIGKSSASDDTRKASSIFAGLKTKEKVDWTKKQNEVKEAMKLSWNAYKENAWGKDIYRPLSLSGENEGPKPLGWTIVESLDTLHIMGMTAELKEARKWIRDELDFNMHYKVGTFESMAKLVGGLLSAFYLTNDDLYLDKAVLLANKLSKAFDSPSGVPYGSVDLFDGKGSTSKSNAEFTGEAGGLSLELKYLSKLTGETLYWENAEKASQIIDKNEPKSNLLPSFIDVTTGKYLGNDFSVDSVSGGYYYYNLVKQYLQTQKIETGYKDIYEEIVEVIKEYLLQSSKPSQLTFLAELENGLDGGHTPKMHHSVCSIGGMLALGATDGQTVQDARREKAWSPAQESDVRLALELTRTCYELHEKIPSGLAPDSVTFNTKSEKYADFTPSLLEAFNYQRPETVESLFILWRITRNPIYRQWGWNIFEAYRKWTKVNDGAAGFTSVQDVTSAPPALLDSMSPYWMGETLKYLYLLFDESAEEVLPLSDVVFNSHGHPFPKFPPVKTAFKRPVSHQESHLESAKGEKGDIVKKGETMEADAVDKKKTGIDKAAYAEGSIADEEPGIDTAKSNKAATKEADTGLEAKNDASVKSASKEAGIKATHKESVDDTLGSKKMAYDKAEFKKADIQIALEADPKKEVSKKTSNSQAAAVGGEVPDFSDITDKVDTIQKIGTYEKVEKYPTGMEEPIKGQIDNTKKDKTVYQTAIS